MMFTITNGSPMATVLKGAFCTAHMEMSCLRCCPRLYMVTLLYSVRSANEKAVMPLRLAVWSTSDIYAILIGPSLKPLINRQISTRLSFRDNARAYRTEARRLRQHGINCPSIRGYLWICKFSANSVIWRAVGDGSDSIRQFRNGSNYNGEV